MIANNVALDHETDILNDLLAKAQDVFYAAGFRVTANILLNDSHFLVYGKLENDWCFYTLNIETQALSKLERVSRELRVHAGLKLDELRQALLDVGDQQLEEIRKAQKSVIDCMGKLL